MTEKFKELINTAAQPVTSSSVHTITAPAGKQLLITKLKATLNGSVFGTISAGHSGTPLFNVRNLAEMAGDDSLLLEPGESLTVDFRDALSSYAAFSSAYKVTGGSAAKANLIGLSNLNGNLSSRCAVGFWRYGEPVLAVADSGGTLRTYNPLTGIQLGAVSITAEVPGGGRSFFYSEGSLYVKGDTGNTSLRRVPLSHTNGPSAIGHHTDVTLSTSFSGGNSSGGIMLEHNGKAYSIVVGNSKLRAWSLDSPTVTSTSIPHFSYIYGASIITTTEATPRELLVVAGGNLTVVIDIVALTVTSYAGTGETLTTLQALNGNAGYQLKPGVFECSREGQTLTIDFNSGAPQFTYDEQGRGLFGRNSHSSYPGVATFRETPTYDLYACCVEIPVETV